MALRRRSSGVRRRSSPRRQMLWARSVPANAGAGLAIPISTVSSVDLLADFEGASGARVQGATIVGIRGWLDVGFAAAPGYLWWGIGVFDRGVGPQGPAGGNRYGDWMAYGAKWGGAGAVGGRPAPQDDMLNVRSKRKLAEINETLFLVFENSISSAATAGWQMSILLAMP